jgi:hypothetical protein
VKKLKWVLFLLVAAFTLAACQSLGMDGSDTDPFIQSLVNLEKNGKISAGALKLLLNAYREALATGNTASFWEQAGTFLGSAATGVLGSLFAVYKWRGGVNNRAGSAPGTG